MYNVTTEQRDLFIYSNQPENTKQIYIVTANTGHIVIWVIIGKYIYKGGKYKYNIWASVNMYR